MCTLLTMSLRPLRTLLMIAEHGSFAEAARAAHLTESAVSMQMKSLEIDLGVVLFDRATRPPALTAAAVALLPGIAEVIEAYERLRQPGVGPLPAVSGTLRLGAVPSVTVSIVPEALAEVARKYSDARIELRMGLSAELVEQLTQGALDAAVVSELPRTPRGMTWQPFVEEPLMLIAPVDTPDLGAAELLGRFPFIRYSRKAWVGELIETLLRRRRLKVNEIMTLDTLEAVTAMVRHRLGVSIVPVAPQRSHGVASVDGVRHIALPGPTVHRVIGLLYRRDQSTAALAVALLAELQQASASGGAHENGPRMPSLSAPRAPRRPATRGAARGRQLKAN
jgi:DNA-binding transcriptional LysR family regulator